MCVADRVQKGRFTVIDMSHHADNRRTGDKRIFRILCILQKLGNQILLFLMLAQNVVIHCDILCFLVCQLLVQRHHFSLQEKLLDQRGWLKLHLVGKIAKCENIRQRDGLDLFFLHGCNRLRFVECAGAVRILFLSGCDDPVILVKPIVLVLGLVTIVLSTGTSLPISVFAVKCSFLIRAFSAAEALSRRIRASGSRRCCSSL